MGEHVLTDRFRERTRAVIATGLVCASCEKNDRLYSDLHGTFCERCGPATPLKSVRAHPRPKEEDRG